MMKKYHIVFLLFFGLLFTWSCRKKDIYPVEPKLEFYSFHKIPNNFQVDDKGILTVLFTDGDADIGLAPEDTLPPYSPGTKYYYNCYISYFEKQKGQWVEIKLPVSNNSRIPLIESDVPDRGIRGTIAVELFINNYTSPYDTVKFSMYIYDRALHQSNTVETPEIIIDKSP